MLWVGETRLETFKPNNLISTNSVLYLTLLSIPLQHFRNRCLTCLNRQYPITYSKVSIVSLSGWRLIFLNLKFMRREYSLGYEGRMKSLVLESLIKGLPTEILTALFFSSSAVFGKHLFVNID